VRVENSFRTSVYFVILGNACIDFFRGFEAEHKDS
jgi:hypothetical protein